MRNRGIASASTAPVQTPKRRSEVPRVLYAVIACSACRMPWLIELRHATVSCPTCQTRVDVQRRRRLWEGADQQAARVAVGAHRAAMATGEDPATIAKALEPEQPLVRHDDPLDAAAAQARQARNLSERADLLALWGTRLMEGLDHAILMEGLRRAGLPGDRAEKEIVRMLATDVIYEPRPGQYRHLEA